MLRISSILFLAVLLVLTVIAVVTPANGQTVDSSNRTEVAAAGNDESAYAFLANPARTAAATRISPKLRQRLENSALGVTNHLASSPDSMLIAFSYQTTETAEQLLGYDHCDGTMIYRWNGSRYAKIDGLFNPSWTPDGRLVLSGSMATGEVFDQARVPFKPGIYITDKKLHEPAPIPFQLNSNDAGLLQQEITLRQSRNRGIDAVEMFHRRNEGQPLFPAVSPDGRRIAFIMSNQLLTMTIDGKDVQLRTIGVDHALAPHWSPDGAMVAFTTITLSPEAEEGEEYETRREIVVPATGSAPLDFSWLAVRR